MAEFSSTPVALCILASAALYICKEDSALAMRVTRHRLSHILEIWIPNIEKLYTKIFLAYVIARGEYYSSMIESLAANFRRRYEAFSHLIFFLSIQLNAPKRIIRLYRVLDINYSMLFVLSVWVMLKCTSLFLLNFVIIKSFSGNPNSDSQCHTGVTNISLSARIRFKWSNPNQTCCFLKPSWESSRQCQRNSSILFVNT